MAGTTGSSLMSGNVNETGGANSRRGSRRAAWRQALGVVALGVASAACSSGSTAPSEGSTSAREDMLERCVQQRNGPATTQSVAATSPDGLRVEVSHTIGTGEELTVGIVAQRHDKRLFETRTTAGSSGAIRSTTTFGRESGQPFTEVALESRDGRIYEGTIDGRGLAPFDMDRLKAGEATISFADGTPVPSAARGDWMQAVARLLEKAVRALPTCSEPEGPGFHEQSVPGHRSNLFGQCQTCKGNCLLDYGICLVGAGGCAIVWWCPWCAAACVAAWTAYCSNKQRTCVGDCQAIGHPCCPVFCGSNRCCLSSETCLDTGLGLCCSAGYDPCKGLNPSCYDPHIEVCIPGGGGTTCPLSQKVCGTTCCPPGGECTGTACCSMPDVPCGNVCCRFSDDQQCVSGACCPRDRACSTGCCPPGMICNKTTGDCYTPGACPTGTERKYDRNGVASCCRSGTLDIACNGTCCTYGLQDCCYQTPVECVPALDKCVSPW